MPQLRETWTHGSAGSLSFVTYGVQTVGSAAVVVNNAFFNHDAWVSAPARPHLLRGHSSFTPLYAAGVGAAPGSDRHAVRRTAAHRVPQEAPAADDRTAERRRAGRSQQRRHQRGPSRERGGAGRPDFIFTEHLAKEMSRARALHTAVSCIT